MINPFRKPWFVTVPDLGRMSFRTEEAAWKFIDGKGLHGIDPYRRLLPRDARPERKSA